MFSRLGKIFIVSIIVASIVFLYLVYSFFNVVSKDPKSDYEGDLVPLSAEMAKANDYEKAAKRILANIRNNEGQSDDLSKIIVTDEVVNYQIDSLKLRFTCSRWYDIEVTDSDTTIIFRAGTHDYYMRGNWKNWSLYTVFKHSVLYTTKKIDEGIYYYHEYEDYGVVLPNIDIKLRDRLYYRISSSVDD